MLLIVDTQFRDSAHNRSDQFFSLQNILGALVNRKYNIYMGHLLQDCHHIANLQITSYKIMQSHASLCLIHNPFGILYKKRGLNFTYFMVQKLEGKKGEVFIIGAVILARLVKVYSWGVYFFVVLVQLNHMILSF